jgi:twitching motility two-component system response regulator PilH
MGIFSMVTAPKILIIDDSATLCVLMKNILSEHGYRVVIATDGAEGVMLLHREQPDCVVVDVVLPGMSGYEISRHIRASKGEPPPVIMISTKSSPVDRSWGLRQGASRYLVKPFAEADFLKTVREVLDEQTKKRTEQVAPRYAENVPPEPVYRESIEEHWRQRQPPQSPRVTQAMPSLYGISQNDWPVQNSPANRPHYEAPHSFTLLQLVPHRLEGRELHWGHSPQALGVVERKYRLVYDAIDGRRSIEKICHATQMNVDEVVFILRRFVGQQRITLHDPLGQPVSNTALG